MVAGLSSMQTGAFGRPLFHAAKKASAIWSTIWSTLWFAIKPASPAAPVPI